MSGDPHVPQARRALAVADAPLDALIADADGLARRWAIALINQRPLERIGEIPLEAFALKAPPLCALVVRSLGSDAELESMTGRGLAGGRQDSAPARTLRALAGARSGPAAVEAVEALRGVLWDALLGELHWLLADQSSSRLLADLADRLAYACASLLAASLAQDPVAAADGFEIVTSPGAAAVDELDRPSRRARVVLIDERGDAPARRAATSPTAPAHGLEGRVAERGRSHGAGGRGHAARRTPSDGVPPIDRLDQSSASGTPPTRARPLPWDTPLRADRADRADEADEAASAFGEGRTKEGGEDAAGEGGAAGHPAIRVTRRTTPVDGAA
ncbi:MAG: hypothetical protein ACHQC8_00430 [Solirubrobacterales bacterium]